MTIEDYRKVIFDKIKYEPTESQRKVHESNARIKLVAGGERGGKSVVGSKEAVLAAPRSKLIWIVGPEFDIARTEFEYCLEDLTKLGLVDKNSISFPKQGACSFKLWGGCEITTKTASEPQKLGMEAPDFILGCESAQMDYEAYLRLRGRIAEKRAPMVMTGTFEGSLGWYPDYFTRWQAPNDEDAQSFSIPSWSNSRVYPGGETDPEILRLKNETPNDIFQERYGGIPCKPSGLIMSEFSVKSHVESFEFDSSLPVEIAVDVGYGAPAAYAVLAIQVKEGVVYLIDEIYLSGYVTEEIITIAKQRRWWGKVQAGAIDIAAKQHQGMAAPIEIWQNKAGLYLQSKKVDVEGGIDLLRTMLKVNPQTGRAKIMVDTKCKGFIAECGGGKSPVHGGGAWLRDTNTNRIIDTNNHSCKAIIYWLVSRMGYTPNLGRSNFGRTFVPDSRGKLRPLRSIYEEQFV